MTEAFLHHVWQFQYFTKTDLRTTSGETVTVLATGVRNTHSGPDFLDAKIRIGLIEWIGCVEIHINASGWTDHRHFLDPAYDNVVLHVVWNNDSAVTRPDGSELPTLELKRRVSESLLLQYRKLVNNPEAIPCAPLLRNVPEMTKRSMQERALMQRLETKARTVNELFERNNQDWDETAYHLLCRNFGFKVNAEPMEQLAKAIPYKVLLRHADRPVQVEALLFGQAGLLDEKAAGEYSALLKREFNLLSSKYDLKVKQLNKSQWRFLRLRPANFPTLRIAQLAALLSTRKSIFSHIVDSATFTDLLRLFSVRQSDYWKHHYRFSKEGHENVPDLGATSIDNIVINTAVPLLVAYGKARDEQLYVDRAVQILEHVAAEENAITRTWRNLDVACRSAADSQALIELNNAFCLKRRCLDCSIGYSIIQPSVA